MVNQWLKEADSWEVGHIETFDFGNWSLCIRKEEAIYEPFRFGVNGHRKRTAETMSRRYVSIESALLHVANGFNVNANVRNRYSSLDDALRDSLGWFTKVNTLVSYLYRDADNYKSSNECVIRGEMTEEQEKRIVDSLDDGLYFVPACVGMPENKFGCETEADHPWFEWCGIEPTSRNPTLNIDAEELAARFEKASNGWAEVRKTPADGKVPYLVTIQEISSRSVVIWAEDRFSAEENAHDLCNNGTIELDGNDFDERNCTCESVATAGDLKTFKDYQ